MTVVGPEFSVLMPMRNPGRHLKAAVDSVLTQVGCSLELLVIDDGCTDGSREWILGLGDQRVRLLDGPCQGISACLNAGLAAARGDLLARCDADDLFAVGRLAAQREWLAANPEAVAVCGPFKMIDPEGREVADPWSDRAQPVSPDVATLILQGELSTTLCSFAIRRTATCVSEGFRSYFETAEDIDFVLRLAECGPIGFLPGCTYAYRLHDQSITHTQTSVRRQFFEATARRFSLQRRQGAIDDLAAGRAPTAPSISTASNDRPHSARAHRGALRTSEAWKSWNAGRRAQGRRTAWAAICEHPWSAQAWKAFVLMSLRWF